MVQQASSTGATDRQISEILGVPEAVLSSWLLDGKRVAEALTRDTPTPLTLDQLPQPWLERWALWVALRRGRALYQLRLEGSLKLRAASGDTRAAQFLLQIHAPEKYGDPDRSTPPVDHRAQLPGLEWAEQCHQQWWLLPEQRDTTTPRLELSLASRRARQGK